MDIYIGVRVNPNPNHDDHVRRLPGVQHGHASNDRGLLLSVGRSGHIYSDFMYSGFAIKLTHRALHDDHVLGLPNVQHGHAGDDAVLLPLIGLSSKT